MNQEQFNKSMQTTKNYVDSTIQDYTGGKKFSSPMTKAEYDAIADKDPNTIYLIGDEEESVVVGLPNYSTNDANKILAVNAQGTALAWIDKPEIPTKTSQLTNDSGFITEVPSEYITETELQNQISPVNSQLEQKVNKTDLDSKVWSMSNMGQDIKEAMTGGSVAVVGENAILNENIVNNQITIEKLSEYDTSSLGNLSDCVMRSGYGLWVVNKVFHKGFIENIKVKASEKIEYARVVFYRKENDSDLYYEYSKTFSLKEGVNVIPIKMNVNYDFYVGIGSPDGGVSYSDSDFGYNVANFNIEDKNNHMAVNFGVNDSKYIFGLEVLYKSLKNRVSILEDETQVLENDILNIKNGMIINDRKKEGFKRVNLMRDDTSKVRYNIVLNYNDFKLSINTIIIPIFNNDTKGVEYRKFNDIELDIEPISEEEHYNIYLFYNNNDGTLCVRYHNGVSFWSGLSDITDEHYLIFSGLLTNHGFDFVESPNNELVKIILPSNLIITKEIINNKWYNKKYIALGDSITRGENSLNSYNPMIGDRYTDVAREEFGFREVINYGIGGSRITSHSDATYPKDGMIDRFSEMDDDADLICVFGGTNDFGNDVPLGDVSDGNKTHFKYALNELCKGLLNKYPTKTIYFITPIHRKDHRADNIPNGAGHTLKDYVNAIKEICENWGIPVLDLYSTYGINPFIDIQRETYMPDGLHPIPVGMRKLGEKNNEFIKRL